MIRRGRESLTETTGPDLSTELQESRQEVARLRAELRDKEASLQAIRARLFAEKHRLFRGDEDGKGRLSSDLLAILQRPGYHRAPDIMRELGIDPENGPAMRALVKNAGLRVGLHDPAGPLEKRFTPHCCRHWWNTYLFLAGLDERYRGYLRGDVPDGSQGQYIHMDALRKEIKKGYLECIPRLGI